ncbi:hypothetical protein [Paenibacillus protaetiae]|uniref:Spore coat protein n=1 Tax=Paenibacillus protaetiae TaxID=2509456 RepID=A0A4P6EW26_9BACL|nr:hypothetical protein [Paenibacillus protaetiae]QAY67520.1 hypothetical protein ET464_15110 [Paenibacillus protaetiae]
MWKIASWLGKLVAAGLIISFLSIWTTGYIVNSYVETLLKQFNLPIQVQPMALSGVWGKLWGADDPSPAAANEDSGSDGAGSGLGGLGLGADPSSQPDGSAGPDTDAASGGTDKPSDAASGPLTGLGGGSGSGAHAGPPPEDGAGSDELGGASDDGHSAAEADGSSETSASSDEAASSPDGTEVAVSNGDMSQIRNEMSTEDKNRLFSLLMNKLPQDAWQSISAYVENGLTDEELSQVEQIMAQYLDKDEYKQMMEILKKY